MSFTPINPLDFNGKGARSLPNQPAIPADALKAKFDEPSTDVLAPAFNRLIGELEDSSAASSLGANAPTGRTVAAQTVQAGLNVLSSDLATLEASAGQAIADAHTHANKALLDTYTQTEADLAQAVADDHTHSNKALLDTYTQSETDLADAVSKKHSHSNKALLDTYTQTETDIADAVSKKHAHSNKALLDTYTQTETDIADAVSKKHTHTNKTVIDKFGEDSGGNPTYDGNPIGGGGSVSDTFKNIVSAGTTFVASGNNDTFKINAGSNVTITALSSPDKGIQISATGGGQSTGDMLMSDYDSSGDVKTAGGIDAYVDAQIGALDVSDSAVSGQYVSAVSETDGKISVTRASLPIVPTKVSDLTNDSGYQTASDVSTAISGKEDKTALKDLAYIAKDGVGSTKVLQGDGTWVTPSSGGHNMLDNSTIITGINASISEGTSNDDVVSGYGVGVWSNTDTITLMTTVSQGDTEMGTWEADNVWETSGVRTGWLQHAALHGILSAADKDDYEISLVFDVAGGEAISCLAYRIDDAITSSLGGIAIKFNAPIKSVTASVGVVIKHNRTKTFTVTRT